MEETPMPSRNLLFALIAGVVAAALPIFAAHAQAPAAALTGPVSSAGAAPREALSGRPKPHGATPPTPAATHTTANSTPPASKLEPGHYSLAIRAVGYDFDGPKTADVGAGRTTIADIKLRPTRNLAKQ